MNQNLEKRKNYVGVAEKIMKTETRVIRVSEQLYKALKKRLGTTRFRTVDALAENLLLQTFDRDIHEEIDIEEEEQIKKRLQDLGYL